MNADGLLCRLMPRALPTKWATVFTGLILAYLVGCLVHFLVVSYVFGSGLALWLCVILAFPLIVGVRLRLRWPAVRGRELVLAIFLAAFAILGVGYLVTEWHRTGLDRDHAQDVAYANLDRALQNDPAFRDVQIRFTRGKHIYWISGSVDSQEDFDRLKILVAEFGITNFGRYAERTIIVKGQKRNAAVGTRD
jgi:hypothetical protein